MLDWLLGELIFHIEYGDEEPVAFRNDYCARCRRERVALRVRASRTARVLLQPVRKLADRLLWRCSACRLELWEPRGRNLLLPLAVCALVASPTTALLLSDLASDEGLQARSLVIGLTVPVVGIAVVWRAMVTGKVRDIARCRATIDPYSDGLCPFCDDELVRGAFDLECSNPEECGAKHEPLSAKGLP